MPKLSTLYEIYYGKQTRDYMRRKLSLWESNFRQREYAIIRMRIGEDDASMKTVAEVAAHFEITPGQVRKIEGKAWSRFWGYPAIHASETEPVTSDA